MEKQLVRVGLAIGIMFVPAYGAATSRYALDRWLILNPVFCVRRNESSHVISLILVNDFGIFHIKLRLSVEKIRNTCL